MEKIAFITGASRGIGKSIAYRLAKEGMDLAINARSAEPLLALAKELTEVFRIRCLVLAGDVGDFSFVERAFVRIKEELGTVNILINNAGISYIGLMDQMSAESWHEVLATNLSSVFYCCKCAVPSMLSQKNGHIINISSVWGKTGASCEVAYSAAKGGVNAFTKALAKELAPSNISVNAITCGAIDTDMNACFSMEEKQAIMEAIPAGRFGTAEEVAEFVWSLITAPAYLTGQVVSFDGGGM